MSKIITLRLDDETYALLRRLAKADNRPLSNYIETATKRFIEENGSVDEFEMAEIKSNEPLNRSLRKGREDAKKGRGRWVD